jgi:hypothetical protein
VSTEAEFTGAVADLAYLDHSGAMRGVTAVLSERRRQIEAGHTRKRDDTIHHAGWLVLEGLRRVTQAFSAHPDGKRETALEQGAALFAAELDRLGSRHASCTSAGEREYDVDDEPVPGTVELTGPPLGEQPMPRFEETAKVIHGELHRQVIITGFPSRKMHAAYLEFLADGGMQALHESFGEWCDAKGRQ